MHQKKEHLDDLFERYRQGSATQDEKQIIARWLTQLDLSDQALSHEQLQAIQNLSRESLQHKLLGASARADRVKVKPLFFWARGVAAALIIAACTFVYFKQKTPVTNKPLTSKSRLLPGASKAILTLGDGTRVDLNAAHKGTIAQQGNAAVSKVQQGRLAYQTQATYANSVVVYNTVTTPKGGQYQVALPDGTQVWLNAASSIRFPTAFTKNTRDVFITGEVYFEVAKNKRMPFNVNTGTVQVQVLGTHFNVMAYADEPAVLTTLLEGSVKLITPTRSAYLTPGQQGAVVNTGTKDISVVKDPDADEAIAWKEGYFVFSNEKITSIMRKIERWYGVDVTYKGNITKTGFNGTISRYSNAQDLFDLLQLTKAVRFETAGKTVTVLPGRNQ